MDIELELKRILKDDDAELTCGGKSLDECVERYKNITQSRYTRQANEF